MAYLNERLVSQLLPKPNISPRVPAYRNYLDGNGAEPARAAWSEVDLTCR